MRCPDCQSPESKVVDSRTSIDAIRRRRECLGCGARFTTQERIERRVQWVVKRSGGREPFERDKVLRGITLACRKRPIPESELEALVSKVEARLDAGQRTEVTSSAVGDAVLAVLSEVDAVAWLRFASVYRAFESIDAFLETIGRERPSAFPVRPSAESGETP